MKILRLSSYMHFSSAAKIVSIPHPFQLLLVLLGYYNVQGHVPRLVFLNDARKGLVTFSETWPSAWWWL